MKAFRLHYADLKSVLSSHVEDVSALCLSKGLITPDANDTIISMSSNKKVFELLDALGKTIRWEQQRLGTFVEVLRRQGSSMKLMGDRLQSTFSEQEKI